MTVTAEQLKALQPGDDVTLAPGVRIAVASVERNDENVTIYFKGFEEVFWIYEYSMNGHYYSPENKTILDIIAIHPKPFDWEDVKPGYGFVYRRMSEIEFVYIGPDILDKECIWAVRDGDTHPERAAKKYLTRAPELDVEWPDA